MPAAQDAIGAYIAALAHWHNVPVAEVGWTKSNKVREVLPGIFTINTRDGDFTIVLYDKQDDLWNVRLKVGTIVSVRKTSTEGGPIFVVE